MDKICRICTNVCEDLISMVKEYKDEIEVLLLGEKFESLIGSELEQIPGCYGLCINCKIELVFYHNFKEQALQSQIKLLKIVESTILEDIAEDMISEEGDDKNLVEFTEDDTEILLNTEVLEQQDDDESDYVIFDVDEETKSELLNDKPKMKTRKKEVGLQKKETGKNRRTIIFSKRWKYHCEICNKYFIKEDIYESHKKIHDGKPAWECDICGKSFKKKGNYEYHMKHHSEQRDFKCNICEKAYLSKADLEIHLKCHSDLRPYICNICGKSYKLRTHLGNHLDTHNVEYLYECGICDKKFKTRGSRKMHRASVHTRLDEHTCTVCNRTFGRKYHLKRHLLKHDGNKDK